MTNIFSIGKTVEFVSPQSSSTPVYEEVDVTRDGKCSQDIQLMSNEAYRPYYGEEQHSNITKQCIWTSSKVTKGVAVSDSSAIYDTLTMVEK